MVRGCSHIHKLDITHPMRLISFDCPLSLSTLPGARAQKLQGQPGSCPLYQKAAGEWPGQPQPGELGMSVGLRLAEAWLRPGLSLGCLGEKHPEKAHGACRAVGT